MKLKSSTSKEESCQIFLDTSNNLSKLTATTKLPNIPPPFRDKTGHSRTSWDISKNILLKYYSVETHLL